MATTNSGPIPGENYTSDTKNYPWRQPPQFSQVEDALDFLAKRLVKMPVANGVLTMAEMGMPLYKIADMLLTQGVGEGKWTVDYTLLLGGPLTRMIELICIGFGVDYTLGIYDEEEMNTGVLFKGQADLRTPNGGFQMLDEQLPEIKSAAEESGTEPKTQDLQKSGFMAMTGGDPSAQEGGDNASPSADNSKEQK